MKKILVLAAVFLVFGCNKSPRIDKEDTSDHTTEESVDAGSGTDISPQLEQDSDKDTRLDVDTINSAANAEHEKDK